MSAYESLLFSVDAGIARITLNRPDAANGLNLSLATELLKVSYACLADPSIRVVVLAANGNLFCAGGDLKSFVANSDTLHAFIKELTTHLHAALANFARMRAPLVTVVQGAAAGAGLSLAACGDIVLAARSVKFTMAYTAAGLVPDGGASYVLPRLIGLRRTQDLMLTNRRLGAEEALDWGLVTRLVDDADLATEAEALVQQLATGPTGAFGAVKRLLLDTFRNTPETQMELESGAIAAASVSRDGREGVAAFLEKRAPQFTGG